MKDSGLYNHGMQFTLTKSLLETSMKVPSGQIEYMKGSGE